MFKYNYLKMLLKLLISGFLIMPLYTYAEIGSETAYTPSQLLQNAIQEGKLEDVQQLIDAGVDINQPLNEGITALHACVINNQENILASLLQKGADVNVTDTSTQATPLHLAALYGRNKIAELLIQKGANINAMMKFRFTPLLVAAQFNQSQIVELLLDKKANIHHADQEGFTALHFAAQNGDEIIAKLLIDRGAKVSAVDRSNQATPMSIAIEHKHPALIQLLQENGAQ